MQNLDRKMCVCVCVYIYIYIYIYIICCVYILHLIFIYTYTHIYIHSFHVCMKGGTVGGRISRKGEGIREGDGDESG
jgi:hypothetical protein